MHQYQEEIMKHGIFKDEDGDETKLVATSLKKYDKLSPNEKSEFVVYTTSQRIDLIKNLI